MIIDVDNDTLLKGVGIAFLWACKLAYNSFQRLKKQVDRIRDHMLKHTDYSEDESE